MTRYGSSISAATIDDWFRSGIAAARAGQRERARDLLGRVVAKDRRNVQAWLWLSDVVDDPDAKAHCLERVLIVDPEHELARQGLARLREQRTVPPSPASPLAGAQPASQVSAPVSISLPTGPTLNSASGASTDLAAGGRAGLDIRANAQVGALSTSKGTRLLRNEFILVGALSLVLLALIVAAEAVAVETLPLPLSILRLLLGLPFVLFVPGYALQAALFPRFGDLDGPERLALSFGLSIAVVPPIALILDALPWGIRLWPIVVLEVLFIAICAAVAQWRRGRLPAEERFTVAVDVDIRGWWAVQDRASRVLYGVLAFALILAAGSALAILLLPKPGEQFTEFYVLGAEGLAEGYPREVVAKQAAVITAGIANHEGEAAGYRIEVRVDGESNGAESIGVEGPIVLESGQVWEGPVAYALPRAGNDQQVLFLLYRDGGSEPYRRLRLWVNVVER